MRGWMAARNDVRPPFLPLARARPGVGVGTDAPGQPRLPGAATPTGSPLTRVTLAAGDVHALRRPGGSTRVTSRWPVDQTSRPAHPSIWAGERVRQAGALAASGLVLAPTLSAPASVFADGGAPGGAAASIAGAGTVAANANPDLGVAASASSTAAPSPPAALPSGPAATSTPSPPPAAPTATTASPSTGAPVPPQVVQQSSQPTTGVQVTVSPKPPRKTSPRPPASPRRPAHQRPAAGGVGAPVQVPGQSSGATIAAGTAAVPGLPPSPTLAANLGAPAALSSAVTKTAFAALRLPLFLLPIYQAAGDEYGIPWQVLAAINEVETNYGFDDHTSSAGAIGWMQFEPSSWQGYGVDVAGQKTANPYNPADAIYAAAAYLRAAGGQNDVRGAIFAYNHSADYVQSVMLRAKLIESFPQAMIDALTNLSVARLPVPLSSSEQAALATTTAAPALPPSAVHDHASGHKPAPDVARDLHTRAYAPVVSVRAGRVVAFGHSSRVGNYVTVSDIEGNRFTYSHLQRVGTLPPSTAAGRRAAAQAAAAAATHPASSTGTAAAQAAASTAVPLLAAQLRLLGLTPPQLRVHPAPARPAATTRALGSGQWAPLYRGELLPAGSVLGRVGEDHGSGVLRFALRPAGSSQAVDPSPYLTAWSLREKVLSPERATADALAVHDTSVNVGAPASRAASGRHPLPGASGQGPVPGAAAATTGAPGGADQSATAAGSAAPASGAPSNAALRQVTPRAGASDITTWGNESMFFKDKVTLSREVLKDRRISIYSCGRQDIAAHRIDRRALATLEYLADSGLNPTISALRCGHSELTTSGNVSEHTSGNAVDIAAVNGINIIGHQGSGSITDITIQRLLALPGGFVPHQVISLMTYSQATNTMSMRDHFNHIHIGFHPAGSDLTPTAHLAQVASARSSLSTTLDSRQWQQLTAHLQSLGDPPLLLPGASAAPQVTPANG
jgi:transglycosylase-like protein with SLT domain